MKRSRAFVLGGLAIASMVAGPLLGQGECGPVGPHGIHTCVYLGQGPTIVLAAGAGQDSRTWSPLVGDLVDFGTVVTFDRPGLGRSPSVEGSRSPTEIARELHGLLSELALAGPTLLVGHSMGGIHALRYAELYPESVVGVVLLDTPPRGFEEARMSLLSAQEQAQRRTDLAAGRARAPEIVGRERDDAASEAWAFPDFSPDVPLRVVVADSQYFGELGDEQAHRELWLKMSEEWLDLSNEGELIVAEGSGHMVHRERPDVVVGLVQRLMGGGGASRVQHSLYR